MSELREKVVLITGASSGIGAAVALAFGDRGSDIVVHYRKRLEEAEMVARQVHERGGRPCIEQADLTEPDQVSEMIERVIARYGRIDVLINNAGGMLRRVPFTQVDDGYIDQIFDLNARSVISVSRHVIPPMTAAGGGCIINVTTQAARTGGGFGGSIYAASKGFISTLTRSMAKELAPQRIRVNAVAPGVIDTPFHDGLSSPEMLQQFAAAIPMGRLGSAAECAGAFLFLADDAASSYVTGQIIEVNGGQVTP
jgi:3-oxoacyl-[acyl-carrier protein] reductase